MGFMILFAAFAMSSSAAALPAGSAGGSAPSAAATAPAQSLAASKGECVRIGVRHADRRGRGARVRRLDELPAGQLHHAVLRQVGGCVIPAVVREGIGR